MEIASRNIKVLCKTVPAVQRVQPLEGSPCTCHRCGGNHQSNVSSLRFANYEHVARKAILQKMVIAADLNWTPDNP